jgi:PadR family transcriptional regulator, regulatory protein AphA
VRTSPTRTRTSTLTATEGAVLALLAIEGERSGYDLTKLVSTAIAHVWSPAKTQLYAVLPRLERHGFATARSVVQTNRPDKRLYKISKAGRRALSDWLEEVVPGDAQLFYLKAFLGGLMDRDSLIAHYEQFARDQQARLDELRAIEPTNTRRGHDYYFYFLLRYGIERAEQSVRWAEDSIRELRRRR